MPGDQRLHRQRDRQVEDHDPRRGKRAIVDRGAVFDRDRHFAHDLARRVERDMGHAVGPRGIVTDRVVFARRRVAVRVGGERARQAAAEIAVTQRFEVVRKLGRVGPRLDQRENAGAEGDDIGVDRIVHPAARAGRGRQARNFFQRARADVAVAIPPRPALRDPHAVDHAVADEPVVAARVGMFRVRPDPQVSPVERGRDRPRDRQVFQRQLLLHRCVEPLREGIVLLQAGTVERGNLADPCRYRAANGLFQNACHAGLLPLADVNNVNIAQV